MDAACARSGNEPCPTALPPVLHASAQCPGTQTYAALDAGKGETDHFHAC